MRKRLGLLAIAAFVAASVMPHAQQEASLFEPPQIISTAEAAYPPNVVAGGTVVLEVTVGPTGGIENVRVVQPAKGFTDQALKAVSKWKFQPARLHGNPVAASVPVAFSFSQPIVWWTSQKK
jgi:TonB family protein